MEKKQRRNYTPEEKVVILKKHLIDKISVPDLCDEYDLQPTVFYDWQKKFFENGACVFAKKNGNASSLDKRKIEALEKKMEKKNEVLSELMEEHIALKKNLGEI
jgi:transposase-like protein